MRFYPNSLYHIYNRGNNKQVIFPMERNYDYFLKKLAVELKDLCDVLAYCLMPNHFHFLINTNEQSMFTKTIGSIEKNVISEGLRTLLSSYTQAINKQEDSWFLC